MATTVPTPVDEYLSTSYQPDCEFIDGEVQARNLGEFEHATIQASLILWFGNHAQEWNIRVLPEQRIRIGPSQYRVPDITVLTRDQPIEKIFTQPPLLLIEILSSEDRLSRIQQRVDDYVAMGVKHIWLLDPAAREAYRCSARGFEKATQLAIPGTEILLPLPAIFSALDGPPL